MKIIIINLKNRKERLRRCLETLSVQGVPDSDIEVFHPNVYKKQDNLIKHIAADIAPLLKQLTGLETLRYMGTNCAHIAVLQKLESLAPSDYGLVLEDDFLLNVPYPQLTEAMDALNANRNSHKKSELIVQLGTWGRNLLPSPPAAVKVIGACYVNFPLYGCHAMLYNAKGAALLKEQMTSDMVTVCRAGGCFALDTYMYHFLRQYQSYTVSQDSTFFVYNAQAGTDN